jgi:hypothetical protein
MADQYILTRAQINELVNFSVKEGEFAEQFQIGVDQVVLDQMISTMLMGYDAEVEERDADIFDWIQIGVLNGWCSEPACDTHDGVPMTDEEADEWEEGYDPCMHILRLWGD